MPGLRRTSLLLLLLLLLLATGALSALQAQRPAAIGKGGELRIGVAGSEPFVVMSDGNTTEPRGIAVEIWRAVAAQSGWPYRLIRFPNVPAAMDALRDGKLDAAVGPITITAERFSYCRFSQPFFSSHLAILSRAESPNLWQRLAPFFSESFFFAVGFLLTVLAVVGALIWLAERRIADSHFPQDPLHGIGAGIWFAIVTMSTVGYGDMAPRTVFGRIVTGIWIIVSIIAATSLVAGIASTLTITGINSAVISTAEQLRNRPIAVLAGSPAEDFVARWGARIQGTPSLDAAFDLLDRGAADAIVFDRPQLRYHLKAVSVSGVSLGTANYEPQHYGFALPLDTQLQHQLNLRLLQLRETGVIDRIAQSWLGVTEE